MGLICRPLLATLALVTIAAGAAADPVLQAIELQRKGSLKEARTLLEAAVPQLRASSDSTKLARALNLAADLALALGDYPSVVQHGQEALELHRRAGDTLGQARDLNSSGTAHIYLGEFTAAEREFEVALALDRANADAEGEVARLNNLGNALYFQGRYPEALRDYQTALELVHAQPRAAWLPRRLQITVVNLATLYQRIGDERRSLELYSSLRKQPQAMRPGEEAQLLLNEGALYRRLGDPVKALEVYRAAQTLFAREHHADAEIGALRNIGIALGLDLNDLPGALESFGAALTLAEQTSNGRGVAQARLYRGEVLRRMGRTEEASHELELALTRAREARLIEEQWKALFALGRIASGHEAEQRYREAIRVIESVRTGLDQPALRVDFLADKRDVYDALIEALLARGEFPLREMFQLLEQVRARALRDRLDARPVSLAAVQSRLAADEMLVEYWTHGTSACALWIEAHDVGVARLEWDPQAAPALVQALATGGDWKNAARDLGGRLFGQLPLGRASLRRLLIVPDGALQLLPFEALGEPPLIERFEISYLPSAGLAPAQVEPRRWRFPWQREMVAFANPARGSAIVAAAETWNALPASAAEVSNAAHEFSGRAEVHVAENAQKVWLRGDRLENLPILHFATHAAIDTQNPDRSRILLAPAPGRPEQDYLFLGEITGLDLKGVDLVTVSACDTERGRSIRGEGPQNFSRAFLAAGARSTLTSLWEVADQPAAQFMQQFYFALSEGRSKADALRWAKLRFLHGGADLAQPRYWAAFVLTGDGRSQVPRAIPWSVLGGFALTLAALIALWRSRRTVSAG
jgi:tetratricopeptide (TPR) repeat protein